MGINIRTKGANAEREIAGLLNDLIRKILLKKEVTDLTNPNYYVQRNQNQSAVGGNDLNNTYGFGIEVKRQEVLGINTWWKQCTKAAFEANEVPVLLYRQTRKPWKCIMEGYVALPNNQFKNCRMEVDFEVFLEVFEHHVRHKLEN